MVRRPRSSSAPAEGTRKWWHRGLPGTSGTQRGFGGWFVNTGWRHVVALFMLVFALFPVYWVVMGSFDKSGSLSSQELVPQADDLGLQNYPDALRRHRLLDVVQELARDLPGDGVLHGDAGGDGRVRRSPRLAGSGAAGRAC